ncbi:MAG: hypothetical protein Q9160_004857 [Pyrenula sp. 1 TL-2023]
MFKARSLAVIAAAILSVQAQNSTASTAGLTATSVTAMRTPAGLPYSNPYNESPLPYTWPGSPTSGQVNPNPEPSAPFSRGGPAASKYHGPAFLRVGESGLAPSLSQHETNGDSTLGTLDQPYLPVEGLNNSPNRSPQLLRRADPDKACGTLPETGVTRTYDFRVSYQTISPDGVKKNGLVINEAFPGPLIEANWGDWIQVQVTNLLPDEGTSIHWHGLLQANTMFYDGVPSVSQCPIAPGRSLTYLFRADIFGSTWYHSHYSAQYAGGALGPLVIYGPNTVDYDIDIGPVMLSDHYHRDYFSLVEVTMQGNNPPADNNLINGKMNFPCQNTSSPCQPNAGISKFRFQSGAKHRLRLINPSARIIEKFHIDGHNFTVIANDFVPVNPYTTDVVTLGVGQRTDVIVEGVGKPDEAFWMRADADRCGGTTGVSPNAVAAIYYESANTTMEPRTNVTASQADLSRCSNDDLAITTAFCPETPDTNPSTTETITIENKSNGTTFLWFMNNSSFRGNYNLPTLPLVKAGNFTFEPEWNVYNFDSNQTVRVIFQNFGDGLHPMHLHGHNFNVLAEGVGDWDGTIVNPNNTQRRDVQLVRGSVNGAPGFIVLQWKQDNPGVWPLHCHIAWHVSNGLYVNVLERGDDIQQIPFPPDVMQTCRDWANFTGTVVPNQIDSGV